MFSSSAVKLLQIKPCILSFFFILALFFACNFLLQLVSDVLSRWLQGTESTFRQPPFS